MPRGRSKHRTSKRTQRRTASTEIEARSVKTTGGRQATSVEVDVEPDVKRRVDDFKVVKEIIAEAPAAAPGERGFAWDEPSGCAPRRE